MDRRIVAAGIGLVSVGAAVVIAIATSPSSGDPLPPREPARIEEAPQPAEVAVAEEEAEPEETGVAEPVVQPTLLERLQGAPEVVEKPKPVWRTSYTFAVGRGLPPIPDVTQPLPVAALGLKALFHSMEQPLQGCLRAHGPSREEVDHVIVEVDIVPAGEATGRIARTGVAFLSEPERFPDFVPCVEALIGDAVFQRPASEKVVLQMPVYRPYR